MTRKNVESMFLSVLKRHQENHGILYATTKNDQEEADIFLAYVSRFVWA